MICWLEVQQLTPVKPEVQQLISCYRFRIQIRIRFRIQFLEFFLENNIVIYGMTMRNLYLARIQKIPTFQILNSL